MPGSWEDDVGDILDCADALGKKKRRSWLDSLRRRKRRPPPEIEAANRRWVRFHGYVRDAPERYESKQEARQRRVKSIKSGGRKLIIPIMAVVIVAMAVLMASPDLRERLVSELGLPVSKPAAITAAPSLAAAEVPVAAPANDPADNLTALRPADPTKISALGPETVPPIARLSDGDLIADFQKYVVQIVHADGRGSGVLLGEQSLVLTNYHVVEGAEFINAMTSDGTVIVLQLLTFDASRDLALLQARTEMLAPPPVEWAADETISLGEPITVIGYPIFSESITVTRGILSGRRDIRGQPVLQTDAALNPGVSGGAAITSAGQLIGIAVGGLDAAEAESVGFLIPASQVTILLDSWLSQLAAGELELPNPPESASSGQGSPTQSPTSTPTAKWLDVWSEFIFLHNEYVARVNELIDKVDASSGGPDDFIDEFRGVRAWYMDNGPHFFVMSGSFPEFPEVSALNARLVAYVENEAESARLYVRHLETYSAVLWEQFDALRTHTDQELDGIWTDVEDLGRGWRAL